MFCCWFWWIWVEIRFYCLTCYVWWFCCYLNMFDVLVYSCGIRFYWLFYYILGLTALFCYALGFVVWSLCLGGFIVILMEFGVLLYLVQFDVSLVFCCIFGIWVTCFVCGFDWYFGGFSSLLVSLLNFACFTCFWIFVTLLLFRVVLVFCFSYFAI